MRRTIVVFLQARERILKNLKDFLDSRPVKDDIYDQYLDVLEAELPKDTPRGQKCDMAIDLLTSLIFAGHDTTAATMVFAVKYIGENPKVLAELRVSLQMPQSTYSSQCFLAHICERTHRSQPFHCITTLTDN